MVVMIYCFILLIGYKDKVSTLLSINRHVVEPPNITK